jgi:hypothetical protein
VDFVAVHSVVIVHGVISFGVLMKVRLLVPAAWVWLTVWYEGTSQSGPKVLTISTGVLVVLYLVLFFVDSIKAATLVH